MFSSYQILPILWSFHIGVQQIFAIIIPQDPACQNALGMENDKIADNQLFSPRNGYQYGFSPREARLNGNKAYCTPTGGVGGFNKDVYMTIDLEDEYTITALALQGDIKKSYGNKINLTYYTKDQEYVYDNDTALLSLQGKKGSEIEYIAIKPIVASKLKVQLEYSMTHQCIRMEIYGCDERTRYESYNECKFTHQAILQTNYAKMKFSETDVIAQEQKYYVKYLPFSKPYAWCLTSSRGTPVYKNWATIDMSDKYLIYGIEVKGYIDGNNIYGHIAKMFKFKYSLDGEDKSYFEGREELYTHEQNVIRNIRVPLVARYIYISMKLNESSMTCIKLELYGCKATSLDEEEIYPIAPSIKAPFQSKASTMIIIVAVLIVLTLVAITGMAIMWVRRKRNKAQPKRRGPLPDIPVYSELNRRDEIETKEIYEDCLGPIYEDPNYASVAEVKEYENTPFHKNKGNEKKYENV